MDTTQTVSNPTVTPHGLVNVAPDDGPAPLATIWIELKPERVQESLAAGGDAATLSLRVAIHQAQTVTFGLAGLGLTITSLSPSYDFFMYYFTLAITPMMLASGVSRRNLSDAGTVTFGP